MKWPDSIWIALLLMMMMGTWEERTGHRAKPDVGRGGAGVCAPDVRAKWGLPRRAGMMDSPPHSHHQGGH